MRKLLIILPVIFLIGCTFTPKKYNQPIANKELTTVSEAVKAGALLLYAEDYKSRTNAGFSKAGLRVVLPSLQNASSGDMYQINSHDIHGIGVLENVKKQIGYDLTSLVVASATGAAIGGSYELIKGITGKESYYEEKAMGIITNEISSGKLPDIITVSPGSKINGI